MPRYALLNNLDHRDLRVDTRHRAAYGDAVMSAPIVPDEFRHAQAHYPIVFAKMPDGAFQPIALFGFEDGENLFLDDAGWDAHYVPLAITRQPFSIGVQGDEPVVHVDLDHPRIRADGDALFREHGGTTDYLERVSTTLRTLHEGMQATPDFIAALLAHDLLESFVLDVTLAGGSEHRLAGFYTIHEERLAQLDGDALASLQRAGHLLPIYMVVASLSQFRALIERRNARHGQRD